MTSSHAHNGRLCSGDKNVLRRSTAKAPQSSSAQHQRAQDSKWLCQTAAHLLLRVWGGFFGSLPCQLLTSSVRMLPAKPCINLEVMWGERKLLPVWERSRKTARRYPATFRTLAAALRYVLHRPGEHRVALPIYVINFPVRAHHVTIF